MIMLTGGGRERGDNRFIWLYRVMNGKGDEADWKAWLLLCQNPAE